MSETCQNCKLFEENKEVIMNEWEGKCKYKGYKDISNKFMGRNYYSDGCDKIDYIEEPFRLIPNKDGQFGDRESTRFE